MPSTPVVTRLLVSILSLYMLTGANASSLTMYQDKDCKTPLSNLTASNGYPDGQCTNTTSQKTFKSFKFTALDLGCEPTVYAVRSDNDPCSGAVEAAKLDKCYETTAWVDFSVDGCTAKNASASASGASAPTTAAPTTVSTTTTTSSSSVASSTANASTVSDSSAYVAARQGNLGLGSLVVLSFGFLLV